MPIAPQIIYTVVDDSGDRGTTTINLPSGFTLSQFGEFGAAMAELIDAMLGGRVESADFCINVDISGLTSNVALSTSDVEELGSFVFGSALGTAVRMNIPCIDELTVASGSDDLDIAHVDVAAFIAGIENGILTTDGQISPCDVGESDIVALDFARERFRASGKRR